jgi:hypothetical protein
MKFSYTEICDIEDIIITQIMNCQNEIERYKECGSDRMQAMLLKEIEKAQQLLNRVKEVRKEYFIQTAQ